MWQNVWVMIIQNICITIIQNIRIIILQSICIVIIQNIWIMIIQNSCIMIILLYDEVYIKRRGKSDKLCIIVLEYSGKIKIKISHDPWHDIVFD